MCTLECPIENTIIAIPLKRCAMNDLNKGTSQEHLKVCPNNFKNILNLYESSFLNLVNMYRLRCVYFGGHSNAHSYL